MSFSKCFGYYQNLVKEAGEERNPERRGRLMKQASNVLLESRRMMKTAVESSDAYAYGKAHRERKILAIDSTDGAGI